ncbi:hypothetical protein NLC29_00385 [Candidatus Aminicenantes bacterium AH-873-B07]|jgi:hypothetical protein|nr:hypothetical protein [Candidatus Aminicenantes bacterium AH-873-B07]
MKKLKLFKKGNKFESLGVKFLGSEGCMCDHDACDAKCGCSGNPNNYCCSAWAKSGEVDKAVLGVPPEL